MADTGDQEFALLDNWVFDDAAITEDTGDQEFALLDNWVWEGSGYIPRPTPVAPLYLV